MKNWILRVGNGENFRNSVYSVWGVKKGRGGCIKSIVDKFNSGDILWFMVSKKYGGKIIGMAEYIDYYDRDDEPLLQIHTISNEEQRWEGSDDWKIQINYKNLYNTEKQDIKAVVQCPAIILDYDTFKNRGLPNDLHKHYKGFKRYANTINKELP